MKQWITLIACAAWLCGCGSAAQSGATGTSYADEELNIGYGTQKRGETTSAISHVEMPDTPRLYSSIYEMLVGRCPGVVVRGTSVTIRGANSILADTEPLYILNGSPIENLDAINPNDVKTIDVLKDASATSMYGMRGANGVIIITTK